MRAIIKRFEEEHPTLWEETEPSLFTKNSANHNITRYPLPGPRLSKAGIPPQGQEGAHYYRHYPLALLWRSGYAKAQREIRKGVNSIRGE